MDMLLELRGTSGRVDGNRNGTGEQYSKEGMQVAFARGQHQRHRRTGLHSGAYQPSGDDARSLVELCVGEWLWLRIAQHHGMDAVGHRSRTPF